MSARAHQIVLDEYIPLETTGNAYVYTSAESTSRLGQFDILVLHAVADNVTAAAAGTLNVYIQHSADARNWLFTNGKTTAPSKPDLQVTNLSKSTVSAGTSAYGGAYPLLGHVRLALQFGEATTAAHVKLHVTQRDLA